MHSGNSVDHSLKVQYESQEMPVELPESNDHQAHDTEEETKNIMVPTTSKDHYKQKSTQKSKKLNCNSLWNKAKKCKSNKLSVEVSTMSTTGSGVHSSYYQLPTSYLQEKSIVSHHGEFFNLCL